MEDSVVQLYSKMYHTPLIWFILSFVLHHNLIRASVYLGLINQIFFFLFYSFYFLLITLLHLEIAHKVWWLCCSVLYIIFYVIFLLVICVVCKLCKSFDKKKSDLHWKTHFTKLEKKLSRNIGLLSKIRHYVPKFPLETTLTKKLVTFYC